jgi:methyl-accepting chemotaxis protein
MKTEQYRIAAEHRKADMLKLADGFEAAVGEIIETVRSRPLASSMIALTRIWRAWAA